MKVKDDTSKAVKAVDQKAAKPKKSPGKRMNFQEAKKHVFTTYRDVLEKLAK
jgi:hypothetical protein